MTDMEKDKEDGSTGERVPNLESRVDKLENMLQVLLELFKNNSSIGVNNTPTEQFTQTEPSQEEKIRVDGVTFIRERDGDILVRHTDPDTGLSVSLKIGDVEGDIWANLKDLDRRENDLGKDVTRSDLDGVLPESLDEVLGTQDGISWGDFPHGNMDPGMLIDTLNGRSPHRIKLLEYVEEALRESGVIPNGSGVKFAVNLDKEKVTNIKTELFREQALFAKVNDFGKGLSELRHGDNGVSELEGGGSVLIDTTPASGGPAK